MQNLVGPGVLLDAVDSPEHHHLALPADGDCMEVDRQGQLDSQPAVQSANQSQTPSREDIKAKPSPLQGNEVKPPSVTKNIVTIVAADHKCMVSDLTIFLCKRRSWFPTRTCTVP